MANKEHTGFRNGNLFCFNCGESYSMAYPQPITIAAAIMAQFSKDHKNCKKTWVEPTNNEASAKTETENAIWWAEYGEHGISSITMFNALIDKRYVRPLPCTFPSPPRDPDDFKRCYKLLKVVPQWKSRLGELRQLSPTWAALVDNWDKLTEMHEQNIKTEFINRIAKGSILIKYQSHETVGMLDFMKSLGC